MWAQVSIVLSQSTLLSDRWTDRQTAFSHGYNVLCITYSCTVKQSEDYSAL